MADEADNLVLRMLREMREQMVTKDDIAHLATKADLEALRLELAETERRIRADVASDLLLMRKELSEQITGLRRAVVEYHSSVVGHGMLISHLDERVTRVEKHLSLPPLPPH